jgi:hypothetical protein
MTGAERSGSGVSSPEAEPPQQDGGLTPSNTPPRFRPTRKPVWRWLTGFLLVGVAGLALLILNNNISLSHPSRGTFAFQLDRATERGTNWLDAHSVAIMRNAALVYMVVDMADMSGDVRLRRFVNGYLQNPFIPSDVWRRMVDAKAEIRSPTRTELDRWAEYQRWMAYGVAPNLVQLADTERADMFSTDKYIWGKRTHQLIALILYRKHGENSQIVHNLIDHLCEGIAFEANWDIRVTDLYLQRIAFLLAAGRPDLVKQRWVERILAGQEEDGGWKESWHGWGPGLFAFNVPDRWPSDHATVQGMWIVYMLKYRYPEWAEKHYSWT